MAQKHLFTTFGLAVLTVGLTLPMAARAELKFCNHTKEQVSVAIGFSSPGSGQWTSEGWWTIDPNDCKVPIGGVLKNRYYYYYADSDSNKWDGDYIFCTKDQKSSPSKATRTANRADMRRRAFANLTSASPQPRKSTSPITDERYRLPIDRFLQNRYVKRRADLSLQLAGAL